MSIVVGFAITSDVGCVAGRVTFDMLPNNVLFEIFDLYGIDCESSCYPWMWHTLVHVCRRWRQIIFASPIRLELRIVCTPRTRVKELLEFLPPLPIMIRSDFGFPLPFSTPSFGDGSQVIAALEQRDNVYSIELQVLPSSLLEKMATTMQETYPALEYVTLWAGDDTAPVLCKEFLGGSAPCLERIWLKGIPFPDAPLLLMSTTNLVYLRLEMIPDSGYISPEAMVAALSTCTKLETLSMWFKPGDPHPDLTSQEITSNARVFLPALDYFSFSGNGRYFNNFVTRIESPSLGGSNDYIRHDTNITVNTDVVYEAFFTSSGISFHYHSEPRNPVQVED